MKILSFALALILCAALLCPAVFAADAKEIKVYTALGDSIAAGYGLPSYQNDGEVVYGGYVSRIGKYVGAEKIYDKAVSGLDTNGLLRLIENDPSYREAISSANLITLSIGSNDILLPAIALISNFVLGNSGGDLLGYFESISLSELKNLLSRLGSYLSAPSQVEVIQSGVDTFLLNWTAIIDAVKAINPTAEIIVTNYYNPMHSLEKLFGEPIAQQYLDILNNHIKSHEYNEKYYKIADVRKVGTERGYVNLDIDSQNLDVHPSFDGHLHIAEQIMSILNPPEEVTKTEPITTTSTPEHTEIATPEQTEPEQKESSCGGVNLSVNTIFIALTAIAFVSLKRKS